MSVQEIIKNRRLELGLTLKDVAKVLGVAEATVSRYETGEIQNMGIDKIAHLSKVLRCSPAYLMGWTDDPYFQSDNSSFKVTPLEKQIILRFRSLPDGERNMLLRSLGLEEKGEKAGGASIVFTG